MIAKWNPDTATLTQGRNMSSAQPREDKPRALGLRELCTFLSEVEISCYSHVLCLWKVIPIVSVLCVTTK